MSEQGLNGLRFDNRFTRELPADPGNDNRPRQISGAAYTRVLPTAVQGPHTLAWSEEMLEMLGLDAADARTPEFAQVFSGNRQLPGMDCHASVYGGHQFGQWAGQLGDGRAINLGEVAGRDGALWMLQLKGAGTTPCSRGADGRAVLRSSLREFVCSEAMHHLGVPTTRALSLVLTGDEVVRDMFYDGHPQAEAGAVVCRLSHSFLRFGHFELPVSRGDTALLEQLLDYTERHHFPHLLDDHDTPEERHEALFHEVCKRTMKMVIHWMRVGFVHGVMNTDNMSMLGETIDYGPYGWIDHYDPQWTPNTTDAGQRRYRFGAQPEIAFWNLHQLANAIVAATGRPGPLEEALKEHAVRFRTEWLAMMRGKLGLTPLDGETDETLITSLERLLQQRDTDMTLFYRQLAELDPAGPENQLPGLLRPAWYSEEAVLDENLLASLHDWEVAYRDRLRRDPVSDRQERRRAMNRVNPLYVPRNYLVQQVIDQVEAGNTDSLQELMTVLRHPYEEQPGQEAWAARRPEWARHQPGCSMLSCSS
ncbi:MAG: YdiU family protein [Pseudohongiellaceae bacterium]